jgi:hypothetical protein
MITKWVFYSTVPDKEGTRETGNAWKHSQIHWPLVKEAVANVAGAAF